MNKFVFWGFLLSLIPHLAFSQVECSNKLLKETVEQLPGDIQLVKGKDSEFLLPSLCKGKPIIVEFDDKGVISHVGVKFFNREMMAQHFTPAFYFIERYFLELLLLPTDEDIKTKMRMDRVHIKKGTKDIYLIPDLKKSLRDIISEVSHDFSVYITCNNNRYKASCQSGTKLLAQIDFPVRYELITGNTKLEAEKSIYPSLLHYQPKPYSGPDEMDMYHYKDSIVCANEYHYVAEDLDSIVCANEGYYVTEDIISTSYYKKGEAGYVPLFSSQCLEESIYNLFNADYDWGVAVEITQNLYSGKNTFELPLAKLIDFLQENGCLIYTGIKKYDKAIVEGVAMAVNMELGYQHMLSFTFDKRLFDEPTKYKVKVNMYSYIPIHNVSSLFGDKLKER